MEDLIIYLCEDTPDGIFTAIYDAWKSGIPEEGMSIQAERHHAMQLFAEYVYVQTDSDKAVKVAQAIENKIGGEAYDMVYHAALSCETDRMDAIYRFLKLGFRYGRRVISMHGDERVCQLFELNRSVRNEAHTFREFLRFHDTGKALVARMNPKNQVLPLIGWHFSERFPDENFVILDENHDMGVFHEKGRRWYLSFVDHGFIGEVFGQIQSGQYEHLWSRFFQTIAIAGRENDKCQKNMCPLRYRKYMVEFQKTPVSDLVGEIGSAIDRGRGA